MGDEISWSSFSIFLKSFLLVADFASMISFRDRYRHDRRRENGLLTTGCPLEGSDPEIRLCRWPSCRQLPTRRNRTQALSSFGHLRVRIAPAARLPRPSGRSQFFKEGRPAWI